MKWVVQFVAGMRSGKRVMDRGLMVFPVWIAVFFFGSEPRLVAGGLARMDFRI